MLTCKIGEKTINCYDGTYSKETLKKWADKNILICHACGKPYEYCHGRIVQPYFRHKEKEQCEDKYSESETEEHIEGKKALYEWVKKLDGVYDAVLEGWIPETHQRPDIMFKYNGKQYVIEYQCTPIASEYLERHELYQAGGIIDLWILGTKNYLNSGEFEYSKRLIEKHCNAYFYSDTNSLMLRYNNIKNKLTVICNSNCVPISDIYIDFSNNDFDLKINYNTVQYYLDLLHKLRIIIRSLNKQSKYIKYRYKTNKSYNKFENEIMLYFKHKDLDSNYDYCNNIILYNYRGFIITNTDSINNFLNVNNNTIIDFIINYVNNYYNNKIMSLYPQGWEIEHMIYQQQEGV